MGFQASFAGLPSGVPGTLPLADYSTQEDASPLAAGDSSGSVGTFTLTVPVPDPYIASIPGSPWYLLDTLGESIFLDTTMTLSDSRKGFTLGTVHSASRSHDGGTITLSGTSRLGNLNVFGIQAQPFVGTLADAFEYYLSLGGETSQFLIDPSIADRQVVFPGWYGELWFSLKQMAAAQDCDISLVSGLILLRPIRARVAQNNRDTSRTTPIGGGTLAQSVEVYQYNNRAISGELVYPPGGWNYEVQVMNVNAGETATFTLELSSSVSFIEPPEMLEFVSQDHSSSSVYTIVSDDGLPVNPALWASRGGGLSVRISDDTTHLEVTLTGARGVPTASGAEAQNFSVALGSDTTGNRYSTFRIVGSGVAFTKEKKRIRTGVAATRTATEVGVTIDNPFISTVNDLYTAGTRAAREFAGTSMILTGDVVSINRRGDSGVATFPTYDFVQAEYLGLTYDQVALRFENRGTYADAQDFWDEAAKNEDEDQVFGNAQGARVFDRKSRRWYRIRTANLSPGGIGISGADDDLIFEDMQGFYADLTYDDVQGFFNGFTYQQSELLGMFRVESAPTPPPGYGHGAYGHGPYGHG